MVMGRLLLKDGVDGGGGPGWGGARILETVKVLAATYPFDVTISSARDGVHSGPADPHHEGNAFDFRVHGLTAIQKGRFVKDLNTALGPRFYAFLEAAGTDNEHIHCQRAKGTVYLFSDYVRNA